MYYCHLLATPTPLQGHDVICECPLVRNYWDRSSAFAWYQTKVSRRLLDIKDLSLTSIRLTLYSLSLMKSLRYHYKRNSSWLPEEFPIIWESWCQAIPDDLIQFEGKYLYMYLYILSTLSKMNGPVCVIFLSSLLGGVRQLGRASSERMNVRTTSFMQK